MHMQLQLHAHSPQTNLSNRFAVFMLIGARLLAMVPTCYVLDRATNTLTVHG
jgi:hypothetical protein